MEGVTHVLLLWARHGRGTYHYTGIPLTRTQLLGQNLTVRETGKHMPLDTQKRRK